jgi:hypothetical protein
MTSAPDGESPEKWKRIAGLPVWRVTFVVTFVAKEISGAKLSSESGKTRKGLKRGLTNPCSLV